MYAKPSSNFGFMMRLDTESITKKLNFASSDEANKAYHPEMIVYYTLLNKPSGISQKQAKVAIGPNPASTELRVSGLQEKSSYYITDMKGLVVKKGPLLGNTIKIDDLKIGMYVLSVNSVKFAFIKK
jgi:hypothetical protein